MHDDVILGLPHRAHAHIPTGNKPLLPMLLYKELCAVLGEEAGEQRLGADTEPEEEAAAAAEAAPEGETLTAGHRHDSNTQPPAERMKLGMSSFLPTTFRCHVSISTNQSELAGI